MIRESDYMDIVTKTLSNEETILKVFITPPYVAIDKDYLAFLHKEFGAEIISAELGVGELMVIQTDKGAILLEQRKGFMNIVTHPIIEKHKSIKQPV